MFQAVPALAPAPRLLASGTPFTQTLDAAHSTLGSTLVALVPIVLLLVLLAALRISAWQGVVICGSGSWGTPSATAAW